MASHGTSMRIQIQLRIVADDDSVISEDEILHLDKGDDRLEAIGLSLGEAKALLAGIQERVVTAQAASFAARHRGCPACGRPREHAEAWGGDQAAAGIGSSLSLTARAGYHPANRSRSVPSRVRARVCRSRWAPCLDHCICCFLAKRLPTTRLTVDSTNAVEIASPVR